MRHVLAVLIALYTVCSLAGEPSASPAFAPQSLDALRAAIAASTTPNAHARLAGELGTRLLQARNLDAAAAPLTEAHDFYSGAERAPFALLLGNLNARRKLPDAAKRFYDEAIALSGPASTIGISAGLNLARMAPETERRARLQMLSEQINGIAPGPQRGAMHLNLGHQAALLTPPATALAYTHIAKARQDGDARTQLEADDALASLYEQSARYTEALAITRAALETAHARNAAITADLLIALEWRQARLQQQLGHADAALAAYERAVEQLRANRDDLPIEYDSGHSSYSETIAPLYLGYVNMLLQRADAEPQLLRRVVNAVEQVKQAELQDYLGDRCVVETVQGGSAPSLPAGVAILYPILLPDRVELLLETRAGITRRTTMVSRTTVGDTANLLAYALRNGMNDFLPPARQLYDWLLRPMDSELAQVQTLVVVPDGALRLLPFSVLHDGSRHAIEKYAVATLTGMTMTNSASGQARGAQALVVGMSDPGPVVAKLNEKLVAAVLQPGTAGLAQSRSLRALRTAATRSQIEQLRTSLQLPGVKQEIDALAAVLPGRHMLNAEFTVNQFQAEAQAHDYRIIHIASHGVFGGSADTSFILAYDDVLTMNGLQRLLKADKFSHAPLELLSLSACETAEGNERAPLGMSGAAIRARAKSVLGTLWPLEDSAAQQVMTRFYTGLSKDGLGKAEALRQAQLALIRDPASAHPFFWGSFILIGNWQ